MISPVAEQARRENRIVVFETIGGALAVLRRLDIVWHEDDIRALITLARSTLSIAQSKVKQRIDQPLQEGIS